MCVHKLCSGVSKSLCRGIVTNQVNLSHFCNLVARIHSAVDSSHIGELVLMQISECVLISDVAFLTI